MGLGEEERWEGDSDEWEWEVERRVSALTELVARRREARARLRAERADRAAAVVGSQRAELRSVDLWRAVSCECVASFLYVVVTCGAAGGTGVGASTSSVLLATALASGCAIAALTLCFSHISGAHVNPAVSCALCVRRLVSPLRCVLYVLAQCGGSIAGAALLYGATVPGFLSAALSPWGAEAAWGRFGVELVLTCVVVLAHFAAMERRWTGGAPLALGAAYAACGFVSMPYVNPARSLGPSFVLSRWESQWVYWTGPLAGALLSGLLYGLAAHPRARARTSSSSAASAASDDAFDRLAADKPQPQPAPVASAAAAAARPTYCAAERVESLYAGTKSLYCRSPPLTRANLHRSQSVYAKSAHAAPPPPPGPGPLLPAAHSLYPLRATHSLAHAQNAHNAHAAAAAATTCNSRRPESVYGARRGLSLQSDDSSYGSTYAGGAAGSSTAPRAPPSYRHY